MTQPDETWAPVANRRAYIGPMVDAVLEYWLTGTQNEDMREWWTTDEASACALELAHVICQAAEERGFRICATGPTATALRGQRSWPLDMAEEMEQRANRIKNWLGRAGDTPPQNDEKGELTWNHVVLGDGTRAVLVPGIACVNRIIEADGHQSCNHTDATECNRTGHQTISLWEVICEGEPGYFAPEDDDEAAAPARLPDPALSCPDCGAAESPCPGTVRPVAGCTWWAAGVRPR